jgi:hypothetical protein
MAAKADLQSMQDYLTPVGKSQHNGESARNLLKSDHLMKDLMKKLNIMKTAF